MQGIITAVALAALAIASYTDIKKREVPDWLNYGLVAFGLGANLLLSVVLWTWTHIAYSIAGMLAFFAVAYAMFYTGQWGGGDSKMLIGLGAVFGLPFHLTSPYINANSFIISLWLNLLLAGTIYALLWSIAVAFKNRKKFSKELKSELNKNTKKRRAAVLAAAAALAASMAANSFLVKMLLAAISLLLILAAYLSTFSRAVEKAGMLKLASPAILTEGDWIAKKIVVGREVIAGPKDLGVSKKQIRQLKRLYARGKIRKVLIKTGIPFVPSFLAALILTIAYGNLFTLLLRML